MPGLAQRNDEQNDNETAVFNASSKSISSNGFWSKHREDISYNQLQKFWSELSPQARQKLLKIDKQTLFEQARKNMYCSRCNGLLLEGFFQIVMYGKSLQHEDAGAHRTCSRVGTLKDQCDGELHATTGSEYDVQDPSVHPWGGLTTTRDGMLTLLDCYLYTKSLKGLQNVFDSSRGRERERELLYPDACGGGARGWISQGMATYGRGHGTRETCALHTTRLSVDTLVDFWTALGEETRQSLLKMKEEDFIERLMYRFDSKRFCRDCRRNVIREFKELKELKRMRREPHCSIWFCVADAAFQYEVSHDTIVADWHQAFIDTFGTYHHFEWAVGTGEGKCDILDYENVGLSGRVQVSPPPPEPPSPPPPSLLFESKRVEIAYHVIQKLKSKITHDPLGITKTWNGSDVCNKYKGFRCATVPDLKVKALAAVDFNQYKFDGPDLTIDGFIDELPDITIFHANTNNFKGTIPKKIANLRYLYELDLSNNKYIGEFPNNIVFGAKKLYFLDLRFNSFSGLVSPQLFMLNLDVLFINNNNLIQKLPDNLGSTPVLYLTLANNKFTGTIPRSIGQACKSLREVLFLNNQLTGCLPYEIGLLSKATVFDVSKNQLTGKIPHSFGCLAKIEILNLAQNQFYGAVPELVCKLCNLKNLTLSYNYFNEVGPECKKLIEKRVLDIKMNCIPGLPMQRSAEECAAFFCKPRSCPDEKSLGFVPCNVGSYEQNQQNENENAPAPTTYGALKPHSL